MSKFPVDASLGKVLKCLDILGFKILRKREHINLERMNLDGAQSCTQGDLHWCVLSFWDYRHNGLVELHYRTKKKAAPKRPLPSVDSILSAHKHLLTSPSPHPAITGKAQAAETQER